MKAEKIRVCCTINGTKRELEGYPMARLLDLLRMDNHLTGTKEGCGEGECGACSIFLNGDLVNSCLVPLAQVEGADITTIEGIAGADQLHKVQQAFVTCGGAQCGICTPGMIMAAIALLKKHPQPTQQQIRDGLAGNLCRCTGYIKIFDSIVTACREMGLAV